MLEHVRINIYWSLVTFCRSDVGKSFISSSNIVLGMANPLIKPANIKNGKIEFIFRRFNIKTRTKKIINCAGIVTNKIFFLKFLALIA